MRIASELLYIVVMGLLGWTLIKNIYIINETINNYSWIGGLAILILLFVLYRNSSLISGWYKNKKRKRLSKKRSIMLISFSLILIITPFILSSLLG